MYRSFTLHNGLQVIYNPYPGRHIVFVNLAYKVGSLDEAPNQKGIAHFFEHMMFAGSKHIQHYDREVQNIGGSSNAFTTFDTTQYLTYAPKDYLETIFWLESDRMFFPAMKQAQLDIQRKVIIEELKQSFFSTPYHDLFLHILPLAYQKDSPFSWPIIGSSPADISHITLEAIQCFRQKFYRPDNAVLIVSGDIEFTHLKALATKWFNETKPTCARPSSPVLQPSQSSNVAKKIVDHVPYHMLVHAYHIPANHSKDFTAIELVVAMLTQGKEAILYKTLVEELKWVSKIEAFPIGTLYGGLLLIEYHLAKGVDVAKTEKKIDEVLDCIVAKGVENKVLQRFKHNMVGRFNAQKGNPEHAGELLAYAFFMNDLHFYDKKMNDELPKCHVSVVKNTIKHFLPKEKRFVLTYHPKQSQR